MSFDKAPLKRSYIAPSCAPPVGRYNPNYSYFDSKHNGSNFENFSGHSSDDSSFKAPISHPSRRRKTFRREQKILESRSLSGTRLGRNVELETCSLPDEANASNKDNISILRQEIEWYKQRVLELETAAQYEANSEQNSELKQLEDESSQREEEIKKLSIKLHEQSQVCEELKGHLKLIKEQHKNESKAEYDQNQKVILDLQEQLKHIQEHNEELTNAKIFLEKENRDLTSVKEESEECKKIASCEIERLNENIANLESSYLETKALLEKSKQDAIIQYESRSALEERLKELQQESDSRKSIIEETSQKLLQKSLTCEELEDKLSLVEIEHENEIKTNYARSQSIIIGLEEDLKVAKQNCKEFESTNACLIKEIVILVSLKEESETCQEKVSIEIQRLKDEISSLTTSLKENANLLEQSQKEATIQCEEKSKKLKELQNQIELQKGRMEEMSNKLHEKSLGYEELIDKLELTTLEHENENKAKDAQNLKVISGFQEELKELQKQLQTKDISWVEKDEALISLKEEFEEYKKNRSIEIHGMNETINRLSSSLKETETLLAQSKEESSTQSKAVILLKNQLEQSIETGNQREKEIKEINNRYQQKYLACEDLQKQLELNIKDHENEMKVRDDESQKIVSQYQQKLQVSEEKHEALLNQSAILQAECSNLTQTLDQTFKMNEEIRGKVHKMTQQHEDQITKLIETKTKVEEELIVTKEKLNTSSLENNKIRNQLEDSKLMSEIIYTKLRQACNDRSEQKSVCMDQKRELGETYEKIDELGATISRLQEDNAYLSKCEKIFREKEAEYKEQIESYVGMLGHQNNKQKIHHIINLKEKLESKKSECEYKERLIGRLELKIRALTEDLTRANQKLAATPLLDLHQHQHQKRGEDARATFNLPKPVSAPSQVPTVFDSRTNH